MSAFTIAAAAFFGLSESARAKDADRFTVERKPDVVVIAAPNGKEVLRYQLERPADSKLAVDSGCYFHPVSTPTGTVITEIAPSDHPHHRGVFLAWVEMHGRKDADFWGWGEPAPKQDRKIVNRSVTGLKATAKGARFRARNEWLAEAERVIAEDLSVSVRTESGANIIDLVYELRPDADVTLSQWAFSGFCVRTRKDGELEASGPGGLVSLSNPKHTEPASDWPAAKWYDYTLRLGEGMFAGVAVIDHPRNPPSLWHNHRDVRMLNPCIVAPGPLALKAKKPLVLRYLVVAHDGPVNKNLLDRLAAEWSDR
ncbi:MAG TPA: DUF6807 family protein [Verrucomicrobiae bacterium]|nr:DUF6807 family protein [Verrucomicrobiae bacterium]